MPRYRLVIAYDGTEFCGWQRQVLRRSPDAADAPSEGDGADVAGVPSAEERRTVQGVLQRAVCEVVREPVVVKGSSRTDSGVHARGQVAAFTCSGEETERRGDGETREEVGRAGGGWPSSRGVERLCRAINGRLPADVCVLSAEDVTRPAGEPGFDPVGECVSKGYSYTLHVMDTGPGALGVRPVFDRRYVHAVWERLDVGAMSLAAERLVGEHDFAAFAAAGHGRLTTVRTVLSCGVSDLGEHWGGRRVRIEVSATGFLYNMVRIIAGTLVEVGRGRMEAGAMASILEGKDRRRAGPTLGPEGLCLEWIRY